MNDLMKQARKMARKNRKLERKMWKINHQCFKAIQRNLKKANLI